MADLGGNAARPDPGLFRNHGTWRPLGRVALFVPVWLIATLAAQAPAAVVVTLLRIGPRRTPAVWPARRELGDV